MVFATDDIGNRYTIGTERTRRGQNGKMENEKMGKREKGRTQKEPIQSALSFCFGKG
jgi:hypothetical protein